MFKFKLSSDEFGQIKFVLTTSFISLSAENKFCNIFISMLVDELISSVVV
jgi:hypothetical protein